MSEIISPNGQDNESFFVDCVHELSRKLIAALSMQLKKIKVSYAVASMLLHLLQDNGANQVALSKQVGVEPTTTTRTIGRMERDGLVQRQRNEFDQRVTNIFLTDRGKNLCASILEVYTAFEKEMNSNNSCTPELKRWISQYQVSQKRSME